MNIQDYYKYSWFSTLAYVDWRKKSGLTVQEAIEDAANAQRVPGSVDTTEIDTLGEKIFSPISKGGEGWLVSDFHPNDPSGFAASLFTQSGTNEKILAIRGTEPDWATGQLTTDLLIADLHEIGEYGMAISQAVSLFNYVQQLRAPVTDNQVAQLNLHITTAPPETGIQFVQTQVSEINPVTLEVTVTDLYFWVDQGATVTGLGLISESDNLVVTGHSLGGHLAAVADRIFPQLFDAAVTYNAPGFDPAVGVGGQFSDLVTSGLKLTDEFFSTLFAPNLPAFEQPASSFSALNQLYSMVSEDEIPGNDNSVVSSSITGTPPSTQQAITTEYNSHMIEPIMDALAVQALMEKLSPNIGLAGASALFSAASNDPGKSEEGILAALAKLLLNDTTKLTTKDIADGLDVWINPGDFTQRTALHECAMKISNKIDELLQGGATLQLVSLVALNASDITSLVQTDIAYRYALKALNPFAVVGADYSAHNTNGELNLYATGQGQITDAYLTDRAAMLGLMIQRNMDDSSTISGDILYRDVEQKITLRPDASFADDYALQQIIFGGAASNTLTGGDNHDHLYGMGGIDTLNGNRGNDYLEGGRGDDKLYGGLDADTYAFHTGDGADTIKDTDGLGTIMLNGAQLTGETATYQSPNTWGDGNTTYQFTPAGVGQSTGKLLITTPSAGSGQADTITIEDFDLAQAITADGYLGIHLANQITIASGANTSAPDPADQTASVVQGALHTFTVFTTAAPNTPLTLLLKLAGAGLYKLINGAEVLSFAADGTVAITIPAGQDSVTLSLLDATDTNQVDAATLSASLTDAVGNVITSNALAVTFDNPYPYASDITPAAYDLVIYGDCAPMNFGTEAEPEYRSDAGPNWIADPNKPMPNQNDVLYGSVGSDLIYTGGSTTYYVDGTAYGYNLVNAGNGSCNDTIIGGAGVDMISISTADNTVSLGGGMDYVTTFTATIIHGNNLISGEGGSGIIEIKGDGNNRIYADVQVDLATALVNQKTQAASNQQGYLIAVGDGDNTIVGGSGRDAIFTGSGNNTIVMGPGNGIFVGGVNVSGTAYIQAMYDLIPVVDTTTHLELGGSSYLDGEAGNNTLIAELGNNELIAGTGNDTLVATGGNNYLDAWEGCLRWCTCAANDAEGRVAA